MRKPITIYSRIICVLYIPILLFVVLWHPISYLFFVSIWFFFSESCSSSFFFFLKIALRKTNKKLKYSWDCVANGYVLIRYFLYAKVFFFFIIGYMWMRCVSPLEWNNIYTYTLGVFFLCWQQLFRSFCGEIFIDWRLMLLL